MYEEVIQLLNDNIQFLKKNDFDALIRRVSTTQMYWELYEFCLKELGVNILEYMSVLPNKFLTRFHTNAIVIPNNIHKIESQSGIGDIKDLVINSDAQLPSKCFMDSDMSTVTFGDGVKRIPQGCFQGCSNLKKVILSSTIQDIGSEAFPDNSDLIIVAPYRDANRLRVPRAEINWYKEHLRHRHAQADASVEGN